MGGGVARPLAKSRGVARHPAARGHQRYQRVTGNFKQSYHCIEDAESSPERVNPRAGTHQIDSPSTPFARPLGTRLETFLPLGAESPSRLRAAVGMALQEGRQRAPRRPGGSPGLTVAVAVCVTLLITLATAVGGQDDRESSKCHPTPKLPEEEPPSECNAAGALATSIEGPGKLVKDCRTGRVHHALHAQPSTRSAPPPLGAPSGPQTAWNLAPPCVS